MARTFKLTWQAGTAGRGGRWRKKYKGQAYYFDGGRGVLVVKLELATGLPILYRLNADTTVAEKVELAA